MNDSRKAILLAQIEEPRQQLLELCRSLDESSWNRPVFSDGDHWTVQDLVRHLASAEHSMTRLMENIRLGGDGASPDFDLARWNASQVRKQQEKTPADLLADLVANRAALEAFAGTLEADDWEKRGRHGSGHVMSIYEIFRLIGSHERTHLEDIRGALGEDAGPDPA